MSTPFHMGKGAAIAVFTSPSLGMPLGSGAFFWWMLILIAATNLADKCVLLEPFLRWWSRKKLDRTSKKRVFRGWCLKWGRHRKITHSIAGMLFDFELLSSLTAIAQFFGLLPEFNSTGALLLALVSHQLVDLVDGSCGIAIFAPFSGYMLKLPGLFKDLGLRHMKSANPEERREFWFKVRCEAFMNVVLNCSAFIYVFRL